MKKIFYFLLIVPAVIFSCKKQEPVINYSPGVQEYLEKNLPEAALALVDFTKQSTSKTDNGDFVRVGIKNKTFNTEFILLQLDKSGICIKAKFIHLEKSGNDPSIFNGSLVAESLDRGSSFKTTIVNGYIQQTHPSLVSKDIASPMIIPGSDYLPEVVVVGYYSSGGDGISWSDYMSLQNLINAGGGGGAGFGTGSSSASYSPTDGNGVPVGFGGGGGTNHNLNINYENSISKPGINVESYMKCFSSVPDAGAECSVTIFTDLPVNNEPSAFFNWYTGATGHCFLQLTKTNGAQSVTQVLGFTAQKPLQALTNGSVPAKMVDNAGHKYNAYLKMSISPGDLNTEITTIGYLSASMQYDIIHYNCVDFALQVVNTIRGVDPLVIPKYPIPGQTFSNSNTPEGLYELFESMLATNIPEAKNILTGAVLNAGTSHGSCN